MKKFKGTEGPWSACCSSQKEISHFVFDEIGSVICAMKSNDPKMDEYKVNEIIVTKKERQYNAKLIAAAPDLLEALQLVREEYYGTTNMDATLWNKVTKAIEKAIN
jgi:hypothetical protein